MVEKTAKVWLGGRKGITAPIHLSQYDTGWRFLFSVYDGDAVYAGTDSTTVYMEGKKADGTVFAVPGTFSDGVAVVECTASITATVGVIDCELRISEDGETVGTANFDMIVEAAPLQGYVASGDDFSAMQQVLDGSEEAASDALSSKNAAAASAAAAALSAATAQVQAGMAYQIAASKSAMEADKTIGYVYVGDGTGADAGLEYGKWYYWKNSVLTEGGQATDPTGTVAGAPLDAKAGGDEIRDLKSAFDKLCNDAFVRTANLFDASSINTGGYYNSNGSVSPQENSSYSVQFVPITQGRQYSFSLVNYPSAIYINTYDANKDNIERIQPSSNLGLSFGDSVKYIRFSYYYNTIPNDFMVVEGSALPTEFIPFMQYVKTDGTFTSEFYPANALAVGEIINTLAWKSPNLFDSSTIINGYHYNSSGIPSPYTGSQYSTQYIPVSSDKVYSFPAQSLANAQFMTYDENKGVIARITPNTSNGYSFGAGVYFVRLSYYSSGFPGEFMFVEGYSLLSTYYPYGWLIKNSAVGNKRCSLKYSVYETGQYTEKVEIYVPDKSGYVFFTLYHCVDETINADNWRLGDVFATDNEYNKTKQFTSPGEIEMAIKISGRSDYIGGLAHGDEVMNSIQFFVDGKYVDITTYTTQTEFDNLRIFENTKMYDPNDSTTHVANHGREYVFSADGLDIRQSVKWLMAENIVEAYMGMLIGAQTYGGATMTDHIFTDISFTNDAISNETSRTFYEGAKYGALYGATSGLFESMELLEYPDTLAGGNRLEMRVTAGSNNKLYAIIVYDTSTGQNVSANEMWKTKVRYVFNH